MVPALLLIFLHMLLTGVSGNYNINAPPTFVSHDRRNLKSNPISGFISIDCGRELPPNYTDEETEIVYTSDVELIDTGESKKVQMKTDSNPNWKFLEYVRSFPLGTKNCYTLKPEQGRDKTYLVRATFMYGNYDTKNSPPEFDLYFGPNLWDKITFDNVTHLVIKEIMHVFPMDFLDICLLNTKMGVPFISALELRHISNDTIYRLDLGSLETCVRYDYGRYITEPPVRYSEDAYDRIWYPVIWGSDLISINSLLTEQSLSNNDYKLPATVMRTAITTCTNSNGYENCDNSKGSIYINWTPPDGQAEYYIYMHFAELKQFNKNREFVIDLNDQRWLNGTISPSHLQPVTAFNRASLKGLELEFQIYATNESNLPPLLNAVEFYKVRNFTRLPTQQDDVEAVINIKKIYTIKKHWQGDPCLPDENYMWDGLNCSYNGDNSPRIIMLNLSSSGIAGVITESLSKLSSLQHLDLSYNRLNGTIPEFLCQMPSLKILNLTGNNLTGSVPQVLTEKFKNGTLSTLSLDDNPKLCSTSLCPKEKKNKDENKKLIVVGAVSVAVSTTISLSTVLSIALGFYRKYNLKKDGGEMAKGQGQRRRPTVNGSGSSGSQLTQSSYHSTPHTSVNYVRAICTTVLRTLKAPLRALSSNHLADAVETTAGQQKEDQEHDNDTYNQLMNEPYPSDSQRPTLDQELLEKSSVMNKNFVNDQEQRRRPGINGSGSSGSQLTQSSYQSTPHTPADYVKAICRDPTLLRTLKAHLKALSPDHLVDTVETTTGQQKEDQEHDEDTYNQLMDGRYPPDSQRPTLDQELLEKSSVMKKNFAKGQGKQRKPTINSSGSSGNQLTQSSYQSTPHTVANYIRAICTTVLRTLKAPLKALSPNHLADTVDTTVGQQKEDQEHDEDTYNQLMDKRYPPDSQRPTLDQELLEKSSVMKNNFVKGQGQRRGTSINGSGSSGSQLTQSSYQSTSHTAANYVRAICTTVLRTLKAPLKALSPDYLADAVETTASQQKEDQEHDEDTYNQLRDKSYPLDSQRPTLDQELLEKSSIMKKNFVKGQGQRWRPSINGSSSSGSQLPQSSYQSTPRTAADYVKAICRDPTLLRTLKAHLKALSPDHLVDAIETTTDQQKEDQEHDEEAMSQGQTVKCLDVATRDDFPDTVQITDTYNPLMDERYPPDNLRPTLNQELSESVMKKNFIKGQGQQRRPSNNGSGNSGSQLTQSSYQSTPHTVANYKAVSLDHLADVVETTTGQQKEDQEHDEDTYNPLMDERYPPDNLRPTLDQELLEKSSVMKKNFVKGQGQRRRPSNNGFGSSSSQLTQSSYQSMPHTVANYKALSPDHLAGAVETTTGQQKEDQEHDEEHLDDNA